MSHVSITEFRVTNCKLCKKPLTTNQRARRYHVECAKFVQSERSRNSRRK